MITTKRLVSGGLYYFFFFFFSSNKLFLFSLCYQYQFCHDCVSRKESAGSQQLVIQILNIIYMNLKYFVKSVQIRFLNLEKINLQTKRTNRHHFTAYLIFHVSFFNHIFSFFQFATDIPEQGLLYFYSVYGYIFYHRALRITYSQNVLSQNSVSHFITQLLLTQS